MWRFYLAATLIVAAFVFAVTLRKQGSTDIQVSARASGTPSAPREQADQKASPSSVRGDAPWALSALPECARQDAETRGPVAFVRRAIPPGAREVRGHLQAGPCSIDVSEDGIRVVRGNDLMLVPPPVRLLESKGRYFLYEQNRKDAVLRVYTFAK